MNKTLKVMTSAALLAGVVAPVAVTTVDAANSKNYVDKVVYVADDYNAAEYSGSVNKLFIKQDDVKFTTTGDTFRLSLPSGVNWLDGKVADKDGFTAGDRIEVGVSTTDSTKKNVLKVVSRTDRDLELQFVQIDDNTTPFEVPMYFEVDGAEGEVKVTLDSRDSKLTSGQYTVAVIGEGKTTASIASVKTIRDGGTIDDIRIDETSIGALYNNGGQQKVTLTLPSKYNWKDVDTNGTDTNGFSNISLGGGFGTAATINDVEVKENKLTVKFTVSSTNKLGTIYLKGLAIDADKDADYGEIEVDIDGDKVSSSTFVVAKYGDFGTTAEVKGDVPTLLAGRLTDDKKDVETVEVLIKETVAGSWLPGRGVDVEFPSWVKVLGVKVDGEKQISGVAGLFNGDIKGDSNEISFDLPTTLNDSKKEFKVKFYVSTKADVEGDVTVKIDGRAGVEVPETVVAKVVAPVKVETKKVDVRTGIKQQPLENIVITESAKGALLDGKTVQLKLSDGTFTDKEPTIKVVEGNVKIDEDSIDIDTDKGILKFEIDGDSTRASKIEISGLSLDLSRSIPEGDVTVEVGGDAIVQNSAKDRVALQAAKLFSFGDTRYNDNGTLKAGDIAETTVDVGEFDRDYVVKAAIATVVTPAEGNVSAETVTLKIGDSTMKVGDKEVALDAAPYIEASTGRTYLPLRAIANAVGASSVEWDNASRTATVIKGGLVAQMTIGQNAYVLNGSKVGMDGKAQIVSERTFLPIRALGNALGASVEWDAATQTVTIK